MESLAKFWRYQALGAVYSAGIVPTSDQQREIRSLGWRHSNNAGLAAAYGKPADRRAVTVEILESVGFTVTADPWPFMLADAAPESDERPNAGHIVRLGAPWAGIAAGECVILAGARGDDRFSIWGQKGGRFYYDGAAGAFVQGSGGPGSMLRISADALARTDETGVAWFWRFESMPEAHTGIDFARRVPVWSLANADSAFLPFLETAD